MNKLFIIIIAFASCKNKDAVRQSDKGGFKGLYIDTSQYHVTIDSGLVHSGGSDSVTFDYLIPHDTIYIHDTIIKKDESYVETIEYYKRQTSLLRNAIDLMQPINRSSSMRLHNINIKLQNERNEHNRKVANEFINDVQKAIYSK